MKALALLVFLQLSLRLFWQPAIDAVFSTIFMLVFVTICYCFGGWSSAGSAWAWLKARPLAAWLVGTGVAGIVGLAIHNGGFRPPAIAAEAIGAYFFFHAFCAVGDRLVNRVRKS